MKRILFTAAGTSDPVRGSQDGPLMHIIRNYRPDEVYILLTKEIAAFEEKDRRFYFMEKYIKENWEEYSPEIRLIKCDQITDPSNIDLTYEPVTRELYKVASDNPEAEILLNLSSGTPAIQIILSNETLNTRYRMKGIAVKNPERKSGTSYRTNVRDYTPDIELTCNEDENENSHRCYEPRNLYLHRMRNQDRIRKLLEKYDYSSALVLSEDLPSQLIPLLELMSKRLCLDTFGVRNLVHETNVDFDLFPTKKVSIDSATREREYKILEYFLILKELVETNQLAEFLLRLNPFLVALDTEILSSLIEDKYGLSYKKFYYVNDWGKVSIPFSRVEETIPEFYRAFRYRYPFENKPEIELTPSNFNKIFEFFKDELDDDFFQMHRKIVDLNQHERNPLAHNLTTINLTDFQKYDLTPDEIIDFLEETMLKYLNTACIDRFDIYHRVNNYILERLDETITES